MGSRFEPLKGLAAVPLLLLPAFLARAFVTQYTESFTTTQYKDAANTTAWWDTSAGELKLFPFALTLAGSRATTGNAEGVAVAGDHAYVADGSSGLQVIDISNPANPTIAGSYNTAGTAKRVAVAGDYALVADGSSGLQIINIANPASPALLGSYATATFALDVAVAGDRAYVADDASGLQVINISNPAAPILAGSYNTPDVARGVALAGDHAYVADGASGLVVIDISSPASPALAGSFNTSGNAWGLAVAGNYAYVADGLSGLQVISISNPANPAPVATYSTSGFARSVFIDGNFAYVAHAASGIDVIDITNPSTPTFAGNYNTAGDAFGVTVAGDRAYVADGLGGFVALNIAAILSPPIGVGSAIFTAGTALAVAVDGDYAFLGDTSVGVTVMDVSNPANPTAVAAFTRPGFDYPDITIDGDHVYAASLVGGIGLDVVDITSPTNPFSAGIYFTSLGASGVDVAGNHAYLAGGSALRVIDVSNPTTPTLVGSYTTAAQAEDVVVAGDHAYVAVSTSGLEVIDISNPTTPTLAGSFNTPGTAYEISISGDHAFVADGTSLQVIDITDPANPTFTGSYTASGTAWSVTVAGDYAYLGEGVSGVRMIDVSNPASPTLVSTHSAPGDARDVAVAGDHVFVARAGGDLEVVEVIQRLFDIPNNVATSLPIDNSDLEIVKFRLTSSQSGVVGWELSADGGLLWREVTPGTWTAPASAGTNLVWRSTLSYVGAGNGPLCSSLQIDWEFGTALIDSIVDVPDDQGGWARIYFSRGGTDVVSEDSIPVATYDLHRRVDNAALIARVLNDGTQAPVTNHLGFGDVTAMGGRVLRCTKDRVLLLGDRTFRVGGPKNSAAPPGVWEVVGSVSAQQQDQYLALVPTVGDSAGTIPYSVYYISTHTTTPSIFFDSPPDSGYSVDNIAPGVPANIIAIYQATEVILDWDDASEQDFQFFRVYRDTTLGFSPSASNLLAETANSTYTDVTPTPSAFFYKVSTVDHAGNEGPAGAPDTGTDVAPVVLPKRFALHEAVPNPFNPRTTLAFSLPRTSHVRLAIYDVDGRLVKSLLDENRGPGRHEVVWGGRDDRNAHVASGVYFYRIETGRFAETKRMVLLK